MRKHVYYFCEATLEGHTETRVFLGRPRNMSRNAERARGSMSEQQSGLAKSEVTHRENGPEEDCNALCALAVGKLLPPHPVVCELYHFQSDSQQCCALS